MSYNCLNILKWKEAKLPVVAINHIQDFLERDIENRWGYYCCSQWEKVSNNFLGMPSYRNRIIGLQMYKYGFDGFLHWGYNFYNSNVSKYPINPNFCKLPQNGSVKSGAFPYLLTSKVWKTLSKPQPYHSGT